MLSAFRTRARPRRARSRASCCLPAPASRGLRSAVASANSTTVDQTLRESFLDHGGDVTTLPALMKLHRSMQSAERTRALFDWEHNDHLFRVVFITDDPETPSGMVLLFTHASGKPSFEKPVERLSGGMYVINDFFQDEPATYRELVHLFTMGKRTGHALSPRELFAAFARTIPVNASATRRPEPHEAVLRREVEEADKIYFCRWQTYEKSGRRPTSENLRKTRIRCDELAWKRCMASQISSCWSDRPQDFKPYHDPPPSTGARARDDE